MIRALRIAIWIYLALLIFEGALRKWVLPGLAEPLLVVRDPVVLLIYVLALGAGVVPRSPFLAVLGVLVALSVVFSILAGQTNWLVMLYGIRTNFLHVPLIWVMAAALDRRDAGRLGAAVLVLAIPMTVLMILQFRSPEGAWVNLGVGGTEDGQIYGAAGRNRPPGFFSFISGPMAFFPLAAAFCFHYLTAARRRLWWWGALVCGLFIVLAVPVSISRGTMIATGIVACAFAVSLLLSGLRAATVLRFGGAVVVVAVLVAVLPFFHEAREVFMDRWDTAAGQSQGSAWGSLADRVTAGFVEPFESLARAPFFGHGIGVGSNVGARLLSGRLGFLLAENEWERSLLELGPLLGLAFIAFRVALVLWMFMQAWQALRRRRDMLPMLIWSAAAPVVLFQQWAPPTLLGFAVFGSGLLLASLNPEPSEDEFFDDDSGGDETGLDDEETENDPGDVETAGPEMAPLPEDVLAARRRRMRGLN
ncbi:hypothetical protein OH491_22625 [Termitidicoccus mucosus]|uniref:hypothetical protein n=1 Tax=Termitidicoccus mucosus TaxID=1184151 RepID=UPI0008387C39